MISGVRGRLVTASFARDVLPTLPGFAEVSPHVSTQLRTWAARLDATLGPASSVRAITDIAVVPLLELLGFAHAGRDDSAAASALRLSAGGDTRVTGVVIEWSASLDRGWRSAVSSAIGADARWCFCCNGRALRLVDARRTWSRAYLEFDLVELGHDRDTQTVLWALARAEAMTGVSPMLDRAVELSDRHGLVVCKALGTGVLDALETLVDALSSRRQRRAPALLFEQSLTVVYRVLFLLFAEARGLVPIWHPIYRDRYSLDAVVATLLTGQEYRGLWQTVRAISRLAHTGFDAGELHVTAFNGRLFAPAQADAFDGTPLSDGVMKHAVMAVTTTPVNRHGRRARIVYRDLDVEQLGAVYERVLDYEPSASGGHALTRTRDIRKASGTFYTPRSVTAFLVRQTLEPLVRDRSSEEILSLRVLDPAMGSGAFLVAACRFLSAAAEEALIGEGRWHAHDIAPADRVNLRRTVASRCLFGVDLNPMAVQLARLSLWLATLAADKPLSFLDHHLQVGNSLVGASPDDLWRYRSGRSSRGSRRDEPTLFDRAGLTSAVEHAVRLRLRVSSEPDETAAIVRAKEQTLASLLTDDSSLRAWVRVLDLWCAAWFWREGPPPDRGVFRELVAHLLGRGCALSPRVAATLLAKADEVVAQQRFLHWPLAFPEVFVDERGEQRASPGFDAIVGNPPWEMVRGDSGDANRREGRRLDARRVTDFVHESGIYHVDARVHANLYQWFVERALHLVRPSGRVGFVLPFGIASDTGAAPLRRYLFDRADVDSLTALDNRDAIFPIHRSVRIALLTCTAGPPTSSIACRFGITRPEELERDDSVLARPAITLTRAFLTRLSGGDDLGVPDLARPQDMAIVERISAAIPRLGAEDGWHVHFGRELNASDDRDLFEPRSAESDARLVVEGKQIEPFRVALDACRLQLRRDAATRAVPHRARLAYRDVASATNRLTLIAAIVPARAVTTHTLFCLKTRLPLADQHVLCALLNSFVANYLVRMRVNTHVTVALVSKLFVPVIREGHPLFEALRSCSERLTRASVPVEEAPEYAELQALVAFAYGITRDEFTHIVGTFPLIPESVRAASLQAFGRAINNFH
jgi:N-6 DNA Methylase/Eco57I restriction-modification methylase